MFTGHINQLADERYLSKTLLNYIKMVFEAIDADSSLGKKDVIEDCLNYNIIEGECTSAVGRPAEIHQDYIDVHLVLSGSEQIGYSNQPLVVNDDSKADLDLYFGELEKENYVTLQAGEFAVFFPGEVHKPMSSYNGENTQVKKAIVKLRFDKLWFYSIAKSVQFDNLNEATEDRFF